MDWWVWCLEKQLIICSSCYCQRCKFPLLFSYYVPRCVSHLNYSCLSMQTSANSAIITLIFLLRTEIQKTSRQTRDFVVFFPTWQTCGERPVCTRWWQQWFKDKDVGEISSAALENALCSQFYKVQKPTDCRMPPFGFMHIVQLHYNCWCFER